MLLLLKVFMENKVKVLIFIFLLAIIARFIYLSEIKSTFLFEHPIVDSGTFEMIGSSIASGTINNDSGTPFNRIPLYYNFIAAIYRVVGRNMYAVRLVQSLIGALNCCMIFLIGARVFRREVGIIAGVIMALYWPLIAFEAKFLPVNLAIFFSILSALSFYWFMDKRKLCFLFAGGVSIALASIARANMLILVPVLTIWVFVYLKEKNTLINMNMVKGVLVFVLGVFLVIIPPVLKDYKSTKELMPVQNNYAIGVYFGLDLEHIKVKPGSSWKSLMMELLDEDLVHARDRVPYWFKRSVDLISRDPARYIIEFGKKIYILCNYYEFSPRESINFFRQESRFLSLPLFNFGYIFAFAILGMLEAGRKRLKDTSIIYLFAISYAVSVLPFMPLARYRLPIVPFFIIFAAYGIFLIFDLVRQKKNKEFITYAIFLLQLLILTNTNPMRSYLASFSRPNYHSALMYLRIDDPANAIVQLKKAISKHPKDPDIYEALGDAYFKSGKPKSAKAAYLKALVLEEKNPKALNKLGVVYAQMGDTKKAKELFIKAISSFPTDMPELHINLGNCYRMEGNMAVAEKEYKRALHFAPNNLQALYRLATLYEESGNKKAAMEIWEKYGKLMNRVQ